MTSGFEGIKGLEVHHLTKAEFDHGGHQEPGRALQPGGHHGVYDGRCGSGRRAG